MFGRSDDARDGGHSTVTATYVASGGRQTVARPTPRRARSIRATTSSSTPPPEYSLPWLLSDDPVPHAAPGCGGTESCSRPRTRRRAVPNSTIGSAVTSGRTLGSSDRIMVSRIVLDPEADQRGEPDDVDVDELDRTGEAGDLVGDPVLQALPALLGVPQQRRVDWHGERPGAHCSPFFSWCLPAAGRPPASAPCWPAPRPRPEQASHIHATSRRPVRRDARSLAISGPVVPPACRPGAG
jgi:hypothetical protein